MTRYTRLADASVEFTFAGNWAFLRAADFFKFVRYGHLMVSDRNNHVICAAAWIDEKGQPTKEKARFSFEGKGEAFLTANEIEALKQSLLKIEEIYLSNLDLGMYPEVNNPDEDRNALEKAAKTATTKPAVVKETTATS